MLHAYVRDIATLISRNARFLSVQWLWSDALYLGVLQKKNILWIFEIALSYVMLHTNGKFLPDSEAFEE
jgi:hypothetical protein